MRSKISLKSILLIFGIAGIIFSAIIIFFPAFNLYGRDFNAESNLLTRPAETSVKRAGNQPSKNLNDNTPAESVVSEEQKRPGLPIRLKIPGISVDAAIEYVGLTSGGAMDVPKGAGNAAWLDIWPRPGENGSAIIAGHYGTKNGKGSVFDNLYKLRKGDKIYIEDEKGANIVFTVRESRRYDPNADARDVFGSNDGKPHLNLITCEGIWDKTVKSYSKRLVVFADKD